MSRRLAPARGFTLVELMVGLAVGLFVSVIAISLFVSTRKLQTVNSSSNRMAENARLAFELLHKDLRLAGFRGCTDQYDRGPLSVLNTGNGGFLVDANGMLGHRGGASSFSPALSTALLAVTQAPIYGSDIISVRVPVDEVSLGLVNSMATNTDAPNVGTNTNGNNLIALGDIVMMGNCKSAVLFQVMGGGDPAATGVLSHAVGASPSPGNASANLQTAYNRSDTAVYRVQTHHYYVAPSAQPSRAGTNSLWRLSVPGLPGGEEVVTGIDRLDLGFGIDLGSSPDRAANRYVTADNVPNWNNVISARIQLLASTTDNGSARAASSVAFAGGTVSINDRRLREVFSEVVSFRNQTP